jgi:HK97 family phage prohead protease
VERIMPGCFDRALKEDDCRALFNHNVDFILGRQSAGTLMLSLDKVGLRYEIQVPNTTAGKDVLESVRRGDVSGSSFSFLPHDGGMNHFRDGSRYVRELHSIRLFDVGPVCMPAYSGTTAGVRAIGDTAEARREFEAWRRAQRDDAADLEWLHRHFAEMNRDLFGGRLSRPEIRLVNTVPGQPTRCAGVYGRERGRPVIEIIRAVMTGAHESLRGGSRDRVGLERLALDILLHEMAHQACDELRGARTQDHGPVFLEECRRLSALLPDFRRWAPSLTLDLCDRWPHFCRKAKYFRGIFGPKGCWRPGAGGAWSRDAIQAMARVREIEVTGVC